MKITLHDLIKALGDEGKEVVEFNCWVADDDLYEDLYNCDEAREVHITVNGEPVRPMQIEWNAGLQTLNIQVKG
jgi:hypothetical protein